MPFRKFHQMHSRKAAIRNVVLRLQHITNCIKGHIEQLSYYYCLILEKPTEHLFESELPSNFYACMS